MGPDPEAEEMSPFLRREGRALDNSFFVGSINGLAESSQLSRMIRKATGLPPRLYRQKVQLPD